MNQPGARVWGPPEGFLARCEALGMPAWVCDTQGEVTSSPAADVWGAVLAGASAQTAAAQAAACLMADPSNEWIDAFEGASWVLVRAGGSWSKAGMVVTLLGGRDAMRQCPWGELDSFVLEQFPEQTQDPAGVARILNWAMNDLSVARQNEQAAGELTTRLMQAFEETQLLYRLAREVVQDHSPDTVLQSLCKSLFDVLPFGWVSMHFSALSPIEELSGKQAVFGDSPMERAGVRAGVSALQQSDYLDRGLMLLDPECDALAAAVGSEVVACPLLHEHKIVGLVLAGAKQGTDPDVSSFETQFLEASAEFITLYHDNLIRQRQQRDLFIGMVRALSASIDAKDPYTRGHSDRVAALGAMLARQIGLDEEVVRRVHLAGVLHDVGKIGIPEAVLCKPGRLNDAEYETIQQHPVIGYQILQDIPGLDDIMDGVLYHHERWDGRGYPERKAGTDIPLFGRLLALADVFDAMSSARSYRQALAREDVLKHIENQAGIHFDPELVGPFLALDFTAYDQMLEDKRGQVWVAA